MKAGAKQAPEQSNVSQAAAFRVPASVEEAYERGWRWHVESFADLTMFESTVKSATRREGLAHFKGPEGEIVIPFVATYAFGEPRVPKYPYAGGSAYSVDEEPEEPESPELTSAEKDKEAAKEKFRTVQYRFRGRVIHTYTSPTPMTEKDAYYAFCDELDLYMFEVKTRAPSARRRTKQAKTRR
jgi:hypothetical protein